MSCGGLELPSPTPVPAPLRGRVSSSQDRTRCSSWPRQGKRDQQEDTSPCAQRVTHVREVPQHFSQALVRLHRPPRVRPQHLFLLGPRQDLLRRPPNLLDRALCFLGSTDSEPLPCLSSSRVQEKYAGDQHKCERACHLESSLARAGRPLKIPPRVGRGNPLDVVLFYVSCGFRERRHVVDRGAAIACTSWA